MATPKSKPKAKTPATSGQPKFGSPAWNAKYGIGAKKKTPAKKPTTSK